MLTFPKLHDLNGRGGMGPHAHRSQNFSIFPVRANLKTDVTRFLAVSLTADPVLITGSMSLDALRKGAEFP